MTQHYCVIPATTTTIIHVANVLITDNTTATATATPPQTELEGLHQEVLVRALQLLEAQGRVK